MKQSEQWKTNILLTNTETLMYCEKSGWLIKGKKFGTS